MYVIQSSSTRSTGRSALADVGAANEAAKMLEFLSRSGSNEPKEPARVPVPAAEVASRRISFEGCLTWRDAIIRILDSRHPMTSQTLSEELVRHRFKKAEGRSIAEIRNLVSGVIRSDITRHPTSTAFTKSRDGYYLLRDPFHSPTEVSDDLTPPLDPQEDPPAFPPDIALPPTQDQDQSPPRTEIPENSDQPNSANQNSFSWKDAIFMILRDQTSPMRPREIAEEIKSRGWSNTDSTTLANVVCTILSRDIRKNPIDGMFTKCGYAKYSANQNHSACQTDFNFSQVDSWDASTTPTTRASQKRQREEEPSFGGFSSIDGFVPDQWDQQNATNQDQEVPRDQDSPEPRRHSMERTIPISFSPFGDHNKRPRVHRPIPLPSGGSSLNFKMPFPTPNNHLLGPGGSSDSLFADHVLSPILTTPHPINNSGLHLPSCEKMIFPVTPGQVAIDPRVGISHKNYQERLPSIWDFLH